MAVRHLLSSSIAVLGLCGPVAAQSTHRVADAVACLSCRIELSPALDVGATEGPGMIDWRGGQALAALDSEGRIYLRGNFSTHVHVYDAEGRYLTTLGREGEGPGEFEGINGFVVGPADSLFVFDALLMRLSVFSPQLDFVRSAVLQVQPSGYEPISVPWDANHFYMTSHMRTAELIGWPIHSISRNGVRAESFGSDSGAYFPSQPHSGLRIIADAGANSLWSGRLAHYTIQRFAPGGKAPIEEIQRDAAWFPEPSAEDLETDHGAKRPPPLMQAMHQDGERLWVLTWVPDPKWQSASTELEDEHRRYDSVIEVIDLTTYRVLARTRVDELYHQFLGDDRIAGTIFAGGYVPTYRIMHIALTDGSGR